MDSKVARILDANFNRAREALRVMEEYARFVLDDAAGCEAIKQLRHELSTITNRFPPNDLLRHRDTFNDVGTTLSTAAELKRSDAREVFVAAAKRLPEALRSIEEYAKIVDAAIAKECEQIRYQAYQVEQRIALRGDLAGRFARTRLYVLITAGLCRGDWMNVARAAIDGGADCLQLREKGLEDGELLQRARNLRKLCRERNVLFVLNDRPDLAVLSDADGVHLGQTDMSISEARRIVGADRLIGISTHNPDQLRAAIHAEPDYIAVGPMFASGTKPQKHVPGPDLLKRAAKETKLPLVPIGGISLINMNRLISACAERLCVCSGVIAATDPAAAAKSYLDGIPLRELTRD